MHRLVLILALTACGSVEGDPDAPAATPDAPTTPDAPAAPDAATPDVATAPDAATAADAPTAADASIADAAPPADAPPLVTGDVRWAVGLGDTASDTVRAVRAVVGGTGFAAGSFAGTIALGPTTMSSAGLEDAFVAELDLAGQFVRSARYGGTGADSFLGVGRDNSGNVSYGGTFETAADLGGVSAQGAVAGRFTGSLARIWASGFGGGTAATVLSLRMTATGGVVIGGSFLGTIDLGAGPVTSAAVDGFVAAYDPTGTLLLSKTYSGVGSQVVTGVNSDSSGNVYVGLQFENSVGIDSAVTFTSRGDFDVALVKLTPTGATSWSKQLGDAMEDSIPKVAMAGDNVVIKARFRGTVNYGGAALSGTGGDTALAAFDPTGLHLWSRTLPTANAMSVDVTGDGGVIVTGFFVGSGNFGGSPLTSAGGTDIFVAEYGATDGAHAWSRRYGSVGSERAFSVSATNNFLLVGGDTDAPTTIGSAPVTHVGGLDGLIFAIER